MFSKFFKLKTVDPASGIVCFATWKQRVMWLLRGCPLRDQRVVERFVQLKHKLDVSNLHFQTSQNSNTQVG